MVDLMLVHVVLAGGGTIIHHQILLLLRPVPLRPILRVAVLHHQNAPSTCGRVVVGGPRRLLAHPTAVARDGGIPHAQVAAAAVHAAVLGATVVVADAFAGQAHLVELVEVLGEGRVGQVAGRVAAQSAELVVRRLETRVEEGGVEVISVGKGECYLGK